MINNNLQYNPQSGVFTRGNKIIGTNLNGYLITTINKKIVRLHRLAWFMYYNKWPNNYIDHINGIKTDNRIENLREATNQENQQNRYYHRQGKLVGCTYHNKKWRARVQLNNKSIYIGHYNSELTAFEAYKAMTWLIAEVNKL